MSSIHSVFLVFCTSWSVCESSPSVSFRASAAGNSTGDILLVTSNVLGYTGHELNDLMAVSGRSGIRWGLQFLEMSKLYSGFILAGMDPILYKYIRGVYAFSTKKLRSRSLMQCFHLVKPQGHHKLWSPRSKGESHGNLQKFFHGSFNIKCEAYMQDILKSGFPKMLVPNNHGFSYQKWSFWGDLGVPPFKETPK